MSVATAGVPHAAASVSDKPHPSASEALSTTQARRYSSRQSVPIDVAGELHPVSGVVGGDPRPQLAGQRPVADQTQAQVRDRSPRLGGGLEGEVESLHGGEAADGHHERRRPICCPPGVKYSSTPLGTAVTRSGRNPSSSSSSRVDSDGVTVAPRR